MCSSLSCCLSAAAICFLAVLFPPQVSASLTVGLPAAGHFHRTATGFPCFALVRCDRCRAPPIPRDRGALMADIETSATTAASQRRVLFPGLLPSPGVLGNEACRGSLLFTLPVFPLPVTSGWNTGPWAFSRASHPAVASDACQERGRALSTRPELTVDHSTLHFGYLTHPVRLHVAPRSPVPADRPGEVGGADLVAGQVGDRVDGLGVPFAAGR